MTFAEFSSPSTNNAVSRRDALLTVFASNDAVRRNELPFVDMCDWTTWHLFQAIGFFRRGKAARRKPSSRLSNSRRTNSPATDIAGVQVVHAGGEIGLGRLKEQVKMVVHQNPGEESPPHGERGEKKTVER